jgi:hypothetical protein
MGLALSAAGTLWSFSARRDREAQLLFIGDQYRSAIARFYSSGSGMHRYPAELDELIQDPRSVQPQRYLRKLFADPMTGRLDWTLLRDPDGGIYGIASSAPGNPLKRANFARMYAHFANADCYCAWRFEYVPSRGNRPSPQPSSSLSER